MTKKFVTLVLFIALSCFTTISTFAADIPSNKRKQTPQGLYLSAKEASAMIQANKDNILFIDVRTPEELLFVGYSPLVNKNIPLKYIDYTHFTENKKGKVKFSSSKNTKLLTQVSAALKAQGLTKSDTIISICRSGKRSAHAAKILYKAGYKNVYTVVEGFEGDKDKATGKRSKNGWKNSGLPWTYKFNKNIYITER